MFSRESFFFCLDINVRHIYGPVSTKRVVYCFSSLRPSGRVTNIFRRTFLSNHASQPLQVSHLYFFATLNKERNSPYLQLSRRLNGKMLVLGFLYSKSTPIVQQKNAKKPTCQTTAFFAKY